MMNAIDAKRCGTVAKIFTALDISHGDLAHARAICAGRGPQWQGAFQCIERALVGASTTSDGLALIGIVTNDVMPVARPATIIGKLIGPRRIGFSSALTVMTGGTTAFWVGEGKPLPISKPAFSRLASPLTMLKNEVMAVADQELVRSSDPSLETIIAADFINAIVASTDSSFIDPASAAIALVRPASVTNGAPSFSSSGSTALQVDGDLARMVESLLAHGSNLQFAVWVLHPVTCAYLARLRNANGDAAYPAVTVTGGTLLGLPIIASASVPHGGSPSVASIILIDASKIWIAEDDAMALAISPAASLEMLDNPTNNSATGTATSMVSMFQTNSVALRGVRGLNFRIADPGFAAVTNNVVD